VWFGFEQDGFRECVDLGMWRVRVCERATKRMRSIELIDVDVICCLPSHIHINSRYPSFNYSTNR